MGTFVAEVKEEAAQSGASLGTSHPESSLIQNSTARPAYQAQTQVRSLHFGLSSSARARPSVRLQANLPCGSEFMPEGTQACMALPKIVWLIAVRWVWPDGRGQRCVVVASQAER